MRPELILSDAKIMQIDDARASAYWTRFSKLAAIDDSHKLREFAGASGKVVRAFQVPGFDRVFGLNEDTADLLDEVLSWYQADSRSPSIDLLPLESLADLRESLARKGFFMRRHQTQLYGAPQPELDSPVHRSIQAELVDPDDGSTMQDFLQAFVEAHEYAPEEAKAAIERTRTLYTGEPWQRYLVRVDGKPAGVGVLGRFGDVGYMTNSATVPRFRRQGVHRAVLHVRLEAAKTQGIPIVAADTPVNAISQRNIIRSGLSIACQLGQWVKL